MNKTYSFETRHSLSFAFTKTSLFKTSIKAIGLQLALPLQQQQLQQLQQEQEQEQHHDIEISTASLSIHGFILASIKDISITTFHSILQTIAINILPASIAAKLMKNPTASALRKCTRLTYDCGYFSSEMFLPMLKVGLLSSTLYHLAVFVVQQTVDTGVYFLRNNHKQLKSFFTTSNNNSNTTVDDIISYCIEDQQITNNNNNHDNEYHNYQLYLNNTELNCKRFVKSLFYASIFTALGSYFKPGFGTTLGYAIGEGLAYL